MLRRPPALLLLAALVYLALRGLVLATNFDAVAIPNYEISPMGLIAKVAQGGWEGAPLGLHYDNAGGHLVVGLLAAPLYALFGETYLSLKLVPVALGLGGLLLLWYVLDRVFDRRAANLGAFLFALAPPTLTKYSMLAKGNHFEGLVLQFLLLALFVALHRSREPRRWLAPFGIAAGFSVFFYFGTLATLALIAVVHVGVRGPRAAAADLWRLAAGFAVGFAPIVWVQIASGSRPTRFLNNAFGAEGITGASGAWDRTRRLFGERLPSAGCFEDLWFIEGRYAEWVYLAVFAVAWFTLLPRAFGGVRRAVASWRSTEGDVRDRERRRLADLAPLPFLLYFPVVCTVIAFSSLRFHEMAPPIEIGGHRYLVTHFGMATGLIAAVGSGAVGSANAWRRGASRTVAAGALACTLFTLPIVDWSFAETEPARRYPGYLWRYYPNVLLRVNDFDEEAGAYVFDHAWIAREIAEFTPAERVEIYEGVGRILAFAQVLPAKARFDFPALLEPYDPQFQPAIARGAGMFLRESFQPSGPSRKFIVRVGELVGSGHPLVPYAIEGLCIDFEYPLSRTTRKSLKRTRELGAKLPDSLRPTWHRGLGIVCGRLLARGIPADEQAVIAEVLRVGPEGLEELWFGIGWAFALAPERRLAGETLQKYVPANHRRSFFLGLGAGARGASDAARIEMLRAIVLDRHPAGAEALAEGLAWAGPEPFVLPPR